MPTNPSHTSEPIVTEWGDYVISVRTGPHIVGAFAGATTASYEIFRRSRLLAAGCVPAGYSSAKIAADSALRIAKLDARGSFSGEFPAI
jgi:hypothetical protein